MTFQLSGTGKPVHWEHSMLMLGGTATMKSSGSAQSYFTTVPSFADCVKGAQCWHGSSKRPLVATQIFAGPITLAVGANHNGYEFTGTAWVEHSEWGPVYGLQSDGNGNIYMLYNANSSCESINGYSIGEWNGSGINQISYCYKQFVVSQQGYMLAIDVNGAFWSNASGSWQQIGTPNGKGLISLSWVDDAINSFMVVTNDNDIWFYNGVQYSQPGNGTCCALNIAADSSGTFYVTGTDNNLYRYNGNGYDKLAYSGGPISGSYGGITDGGTMQVWAVGPNANSNTLYQFTDQAIQHKRLAHGDVTCTPIPPFNSSVCQAFTHIANWRVGWGGKYGTAGYYEFQGPGSWSVTATANLDNVFDALENPGNYPINVEGGNGLLRRGNSLC